MHGRPDAVAAERVAASDTGRGPLRRRLVSALAAPLAKEAHWLPSRSRITIREQIRLEFSEFGGIVGASGQQKATPVHTPRAERTSKREKERGRGEGGGGGGGVKHGELTSIVTGHVQSSSCGGRWLLTPPTATPAAATACRRESGTASGRKQQTASDKHGHSESTPHGACGVPWR